MKIELTKKAEEKIEKRITKESFSIALKIFLVALPIFSLLIFGLDKTNDPIMILGNIFAALVLSILVSGFSFFTFFFIKAKKYGVKLEANDDFVYEHHEYIPLCSLHPLNPATGLPMVGGIDVAGNPCGFRRSPFDFL